MEYKNPYIGEQNDIANPNRTTEEILIWSEQMAAIVLSFSSADYNLRIGEFKRFFVERGWLEYASYLKGAKIIDRIKAEQCDVIAVVNGDSAVLNRGEVAGVYRWLVSVPLMVGFVKTDESGEQRQTGNAKFRLMLQLLRVADGGKDGLAIEGFTMEETP